MLTITIPATEAWSDEKQEFVYTKAYVLNLEHSLVSLSKWESRWCKPFLSRKEKSFEETLDYVRCMTLSRDVPQEVYYCLTDNDIKQIDEYINAPMTAFTPPKKPSGGGSSERITSELIYYWMVSLKIPFECQKWHLNRLFSLIRMCNIKNTPEKKKRKNIREIMKRNDAINEARKRKYNTTG